MELLSKYRVELMGLAMIWIMFFHSQIYVPEFLFPIRFIKVVGYAGVDIFFLLSGFSLAFSLTRNNCLSAYFKRRFVRIVPVFWLILIFFQINKVLLGHFSTRDLFLSFSGFDFLVFGNLDTWFVPAILVCYLIFPIYYSLSNKYGIIKVLIICSVISIFFSLLIVGSPLQHLLIFSVRLPTFFIGASIGQLLISGKRVYFLNNIYISFLLFVILLALLYLIIDNTTPLQRWSTGLFWYPTIFIAYPLCLLLGHTFNKIDKNYPKILYLIRLIGIYSFELFLIHVLVFSIADQLSLKYLSFNFFRVPEYLIYIMVSLLASVLINKGVNKIQWLKF